MKTRIQLLTGLFALIGVASTGATLSSLAMAQQPHQPIALQQGEKGENGKQDERSERNGKFALPTKFASRFSPWQAMAAAQKKVGGKPFQALYEFEGGKWNYGVAVLKGRTIIEVDVDPMTGKAGATESVTPDDEATEMRDAFQKVLNTVGGR